MNYFANNIKFLRKLHRMKQSDLAYVLGKSRKTISSWEVGTRTPIVADLMQISDYFNIQIADLVGDDLSLDYDLNQAAFNQKELLGLFNELTTEQQSAVLAMIKSMVKD